MKISVICASYNNEKTIKDTIESFISQTYSNKELIIIDGASSDNTLSVIREYNNHPNILCTSEPDKGIYDAINKGIKKATGDVISILGADDFFSSSNILSEVAKTFEKLNVDAVYGDVVFVAKNDVNKVVRYWQAGSFSRKKFLYGWMPPHVCFFLKKKHYDEKGLYIDSFKCSGDYELMLRMLYKEKVSCGYLNQTLVKMRTGGTSTKSFKARLLANKEDRLAWKMNKLKHYTFTVILKPALKIPQFINLKKSIHNK